MRLLAVVVVSLIVGMAVSLVWLARLEIGICR